MLITACSGNGTIATSPTTTSNSGHDLADLPKVGDPVVALAGLLGIEPAPLSPDLQAIAAQIESQIGGTTSTARVSPAVYQSGDDMFVAFAAIEITVLGHLFPSKEAADNLAGLVESIGISGLKDGPDGPQDDSKDKTIPFEATQGGASTTGQVSIHIEAHQTGSKVEVVLSRSLSMNIVSPQFTGVVVTTIHNVESVDFCPDTGGVVPVELSSDYSLDGGPASVHASIEGSFQGQVDDGGELATVTGEATIKGATVTQGNTSDSYSLDMTGLDFAVDRGGIGDLDAGTYLGPADNDSLAQHKADMAVFDLGQSLPAIFGAARNRFQHDSCVVVDIPDYDFFANPQVNGGDTTKGKDVDAGSTSTFKVQVHQRFQHSEVNLPVSQTLEGKRQITPPSLSSTPADSTYQAPPEQGTTNWVTFESRSRRGRSRLRVSFSTVEQAPKLGITGTITEEASITHLVGDVTMPPIEFGPVSNAPDPGIHYEIDAPVEATVTMSMSGVPLPCAAFSTEKGTIHLVARAEARGDTNMVWVIHPDLAASHFEQKTTCQISVGSGLDTGAGFIAKFFGAIGDFELPIDPGATTLTASAPLPMGQDTVEATATLSPPDPAP